MKTFRDTAGREWAIAVDVNAIKRVMRTTFDYCGEPLCQKTLPIDKSSIQIV
jgi:hypothetical protein